jgi:competence protein ComEA
MPRRAGSLLVITALGLAAISGVAAQGSPAPQSTGEGLPDAPGKDTVVRVCGNCHEPRRAASVRLTREGWTSLVQDMVQRGAKGTDAELNEVVEYMAANFLGEAPRPLNINSAAAIDFEMVVGLLRRESAAVIAYREKNGAFKSIDELKNVPGLDFSKIEKNKDRIVCF